MLERVDALKAALDAARPLPKYTEASLRDKLALEWTHQANVIDGGSLTLRETKVVLEGITVAGKSLQEHIESANHYAAILYVERIATTEPMSESVIKTTHALLLKNINSDAAGQYRHEPGVIDDIRSLLAWHVANGAMHPIRRAAEFHARFMTIHPFVNGNGCVGRLLLNLNLMKAGYPLAVITKEDQASCCDMTHLVASVMERSLRTYLDVLALGINKE